MTTEHPVGAGADEPDGIDWDALGTEIRAQSGFPIPAVDPDADTDLWPQVIDARGRATGEIARPTPEAMRAALNRVAAVDPAEVEVLATAVSDAEARAIIAQAARQREHERTLDAEVSERRAHLAAEGTRRQIEHEARLAEGHRRRENRAAAALERRARALDPTGRVVRLAAAERVVPWIAVIPAVLAAVLGAVNVGLMLDVLSPSTHIINWLVEPLLTLPLIAILAAQILGAVGSGEANPYRALERSLIAVAVGLNVGLHIAVDGLTPTAAVWAIVPAGLAISTHLVPRLIRHVRTALADADRPDPVESVRVASDRPDSASTGPRLVQVETTIDPDRRSDGEVAEALRIAVRDGQADPLTGRPIDPSSAESIRRTLRVSAARARALRDQTQSAVADAD